MNLSDPERVLRGQVGEGSDCVVGKRKKVSCRMVTRKERDLDRRHLGVRLCCVVIFMRSMGR